MSWRTVDHDDLIASLAGDEIEAYKQSADFASDPETLLLKRTVATVRGYIASNNRVKMGPEGTLPEMLISPAMDYLVMDILKRQAVSATDDRKDARRNAEALFQKVANGELNVESYGGTETDEGGKTAGSPASGNPLPPRMLD